MAFPPKQLIPCLLLLLLPIMFFSHAKAQAAQPCKSWCKSSYSGRHRPWGNYTMECGNPEFYVMDKESGVERKLNSSDVNNRVLSTVEPGIRSWLSSLGLEVGEVSFSVTIEYLLNPGTFAFLILPSTQNYTLLTEKLLAIDVGPLVLTNLTSQSVDVSGGNVSIQIGVLSNTMITDRIIAVDIDISQLQASVANNYTVWIDYDHAGRNLSVYADVQTNPRPGGPIAEVLLQHTDVAPDMLWLGLLSTTDKVRNSVFRWNATIEGPPYPTPNYFIDDKGRGKVTILSSVLGSVAGTALMAVGLAFYFNSRYRRWHKDLDQLARSMECLPGMPTKIEFADIRKATRNFHEYMKLGGGGFGTVYRCTLPPAASKTEGPIDVAVKRFTRDVQNHRYDDFLAEVSIINRLRHKNIVPLVGWSYNKGEPLLVFEFMTNGSLDQHLFLRSGGHTRQQGDRGAGTAIKQWDTRYEIVRDIATGLHYVHHEYEPMVLHRDIKASNVMLDSSFRARLGDFGLACAVDMDRNSATGVAGTWGYIAPEYAMCGKATRQTDIYALGVLILEVVTGQRALIRQAVDEDDVQITDRVWRLHREGRLMECVDPVLIAPDEDQLHTGGDTERLLLLGLACSSPNPSDRPAMPEVMQVITKSQPPPEVPLMKPIFMWPPPGGAAWGADDSMGTSMTTSNLDGSMASTAERQSQRLVAASQRQATGGHASFQLEPSVYVTVPSTLGSSERPSREK